MTAVASRPWLGIRNEIPFVCERNAESLLAVFFRDDKEAQEVSSRLAAFAAAIRVFVQEEHDHVKVFFVAEKAEGDALLVARDTFAKDGRVRQFLANVAAEKQIVVVIGSCRQGGGVELCAAKWQGYPERIGRIANCARVVRGAPPTESSAVHTCIYYGFIRQEE